MYTIRLLWNKPEMSTSHKENICAWHCGRLRGAYALDPYQTSRSTIVFESDSQRMLAYFYLLNVAVFEPKLV